MINKEKIAALERKLQTCKDLEEEASMLVEILNTYADSHSKEGKQHIARLVQLADDLNSNEYRAWGCFHNANFNRLLDNYSQALIDAKIGVNLFSSVGHNFGIASCHSLIALIYYRQGNYTDALYNYIASLKISEEIGDKPSIINLHWSIGHFYRDLGNYSEALSNYLVSLKISEEIDDKQKIAVSYLCIGLVYRDQGNFAEALSNHLASLKMRIEVGDKEHIAACYASIGRIHHRQGNYAEALSNMFTSREICEEIGFKHALVFSYNHIGEIYHDQGRYSEALSEYLNSLKISEEIGNKENIESYLGLAQSYIALEENDLAIQQLENALQVAEMLNFQRGKKKSLKALYELKKKQGDTAATLAYHERFMEADKELLNSEKSRKLASMQFDHHIERKELEVILERKKKEELQIAYNLLDKEKERSEALLLNILPFEVAEELKAKGTADAKLFDDVTVLYTDFKSFASISERFSPQELVDELHACFSAFDAIVSKHNIEKIKTVGDAYLAVSGLPLADENHALNIVQAAVEIREFMLNRIKEKGAKTFEIRIGVHSGSVVAGIVGVKKYAYDIWGDTVNTAARMEQNSEAGKINISETTYRLVKDKFPCAYRGEIEAKNKGKLKMYFVG